jgi:hypothetical protein
MDQFNIDTLAFIVFDQFTDEVKGIIGGVIQYLDLKTICRIVQSCYGLQ